MNYIVGDIQGCYRGLKNLLKKIQFNQNSDILWSVGDLVARGEDSLSTLSLLYDLGEAFQAVLGNHDLHLLSVINQVKPANPKDKLISLLESPDLDRYEQWMRQFPLAQMVDEKTLISHAGLYPEWSFKKAIKLSSEVQNVLISDNYIDFLTRMYSKKMSNWEQVKHAPQRQKFIVDAFTRMRYLAGNKELEFSEKCAPQDARNDLIPWYKIKNTQIKPNQRIVFGHWASLMGNTANKQMIGLDTGYVWGGKLSCLCIETNKIVHVKA